MSRTKAPVCVRASHRQAENAEKSCRNVLSTYTAGLGVDNWLSFTDHQTSNTYYYITDHLGTVHAVTDSSGTVVESYRYSPYGKVLAIFDENGNTILKTKIGNRILFQGREYDWDTGFYYLRARWYDPDTCRWLSKDPIGINGGLNQYVFCGNNPVMFVDPLGLCEDDGWMPDWLSDAGWNASHAARGLLMSPWNMLKGMYGGVQGIGGYIGSMTGDPSGTWGSTVDGIKGLPSTVPSALFDLMGDPYAIGSTVGEFGIGIGAAKILSASKGIKAGGYADDLQPTLQRIKVGKSFPHRNDGSIFKNREGLLPHKKSGYYREYVHPTPGVKGPGAQRIIKGSKGEVYYTPDHYKSFINIKK